MNRKKFGALGAALAVVVLGGAGAAMATGADDDAGETPITGEAFTKASQAALAETGGGRVTATEIDDEEGKYEVEVTLDDGSQVDVHLDASFAVLGTERDGADDKSEGE